MKKLISLLLDFIFYGAVVWFGLFLFFFTGSYRIVGITITGVILIIGCITEKENINDDFYE